MGIKTAVIAAGSLIALGGCATATAPPIEQAAVSAPPSAVAADEERLPPRKLTTAEKKMLLNAFSSSMKDPASVQVNWTPFAGPKSGKGVMDYCMTLNAKNSYGGYVGFRPHLASIIVRDGKIYSGVIQGAGGTYSQSIVDTATMDYCKGKGLNPYEAG